MPEDRHTIFGMPDRALSFGTVAEAYERFRPGYPAELLDLVLAYAGRPIRTALEIDREQVFRLIRPVLPDPVDIMADVIVHLARRRGGHVPSSLNKTASGDLRRRESAIGRKYRYPGARAGWVVNPASIGRSREKHQIHLD
jgi:hypothetical protein